MAVPRPILWFATARWLQVELGPDAFARKDMLVLRTFKTGR